MANVPENDAANSSLSWKERLFDLGCVVVGCVLGRSIVSSHQEVLLAALGTMVVWALCIQWSNFAEEAKRRKRRNNNKDNNNSSPKTELLALIMKRKFREATLRLKDFPHEAACIGSHGDTALHLACNIYPELALVKALLKAYPSATQVLNGLGCAPLHVACRGSSDDVVRLLLEVDPSATTIPNKDGHQALELLCWPRFERKVITDALGASSLAEETSCDESNESQQSPTQTPSPESLLRQDPQLERIWRSACYLVEAEATGRVTKMEHDHVANDNGGFLMVHACVQLERCPVNLLRLAMKLLPSQMDVLDSKGMTPLHYMIRNHKMPWKEMLEQAFRACPSAVTVPDPQSRLYPFMSLAVETRAPLQSVFDTLKACPELDRMVMESR